MYIIIMHKILHLYVLLSINDRIIFGIKMISTFNWSLTNKYNYIMEYVNDIYPCICIRIMTFHTTRIRIYIYVCIIELRLIPSALCRSILCFYNNIVYDFV